MKKIFQWGIRLFIVVCMGVLVLNANSTPQHKKPTTEYMWFDFTGASIEDYNDLRFYSQDPGHVFPCYGTGIRCEIYAPVIQTGPYAGKPDLMYILDETYRLN